MGFAPRPHERFAFDTSVWLTRLSAPPLASPLPPSNLIWGDDPTDDAARARVVGLMVLVVTVSPPQPAVQSGSAEPRRRRASMRDLTDPDAFDVTATLSADAERAGADDRGGAGRPRGDRRRGRGAGRASRWASLRTSRSRTGCRRASAAGGNARYLPAGPRQRGPADRHPGDSLAPAERGRAAPLRLVRAHDVPGGRDGRQEVRRRAVAEAVVVPVVLEVAGGDAAPSCRCRPGRGTSARSRR